jgi:hypothetical protein
VYAYRTRKPCARFRIPFLSFHWGYVGETVSFKHRHAQHTLGDTVRATPQQPWADLDPRCRIRIPLPPWKWLLRSVETLLIVALWPVYNDRKNRWNPRRISLSTAALQRRTRDRGGLRVNLTYANMLLILVPALVLIWMVTRHA